MRVLLVDDDEDFCALVSHGLRARGLQTDTSHCPDTAMRRLATAAYQAVAVDVQLGERDGIELCRAINADYPNVPVVLMTGFADEELVTRGRAAGAYDVLIKPFTIAALAATMQRAVGKPT